MVIFIPNNKWVWLTNCYTPAARMIVYPERILHYPCIWIQSRATDRRHYCFVFFNLKNENYFFFYITKFDFSPFPTFFHHQWLWTLKINSLLTLFSFLHWNRNRYVRNMRAFFPSRARRAFFGICKKCRLQLRFAAEIGRLMQVRATYTNFKWVIWVKL